MSYHLQNNKTLLLLASLFICFTLIASIPSKLPQIDPPDLSTLALFPVDRVVDGDTLVVLDKGEQVRVRLIGVDTPETVHPRREVEHYGKEASLFLANLLKGEQVYLEITGKDRYGRTLAFAYRYPDGLFVNAEIIRQGYGNAYTRFPFKYLEAFRALEQFAREAEKGLWAPNKAIKEAESISEVSADPNTFYSENAVEKLVFITHSGTKYHSADCPHLSQSKIPISLEEAKERYSPCKVCNSPE